jgi:hypothetical protein
MKILLVGAELFHETDKQTNRHNEANSRFSQFCEQAWKYKELLQYNLYGFKRSLILQWSYDYKGLIY